MPYRRSKPNNRWSMFPSLHDEVALLLDDDKKVAITIRMYPGDEYNARVYHQRCKSCNRLSQPILNETYAEQVAYRVKKWNGCTVEKPKYSDQSNSPHNRHL
ncbi:zinc-binding domain-containing protein [Aspergillus sergii]|uniref:Zinc-binding domain-containing protein n=1 Tax=Aspergillus sergii TaxID=1034303 RepID=A0A5N6WZX5_9EURO|nr:zinc-binding domain-containing protein [Aspergillus sergii]